jgi:cyclohexadienyl dehydratase
MRRLKLILIVFSIGFYSLIRPVISSEHIVGAQETSLDRILKAGTIKIGTTGDYKPFTYLNPLSGEYEGYDIDAANLLAGSLDVKIQWVPTTWATLVEGITAGRYDMAVGGITITLPRLTKVGMTTAYFTVGKCPLIRTSDQNRFHSIDDIDQIGVKIGVNPGGTNEAFVRAYFTKATIVMVNNNLDIPSKIQTHEVDAMITDNVEAVLVAGKHADLHALNPDQPANRDELGYMMPRDDQALLNWMNAWIHDMKIKNQFDALHKRWVPN